MATSKKSTAKPAINPDDFPKVYMRLRTVLDALEIGALNRCLQEETAELRIKRAGEIEKLLLPVIKKLKDKTIQPYGCAEGYCNCGGVCVPYQCPADK